MIKQEIRLIIKQTLEQLKKEEIIPQNIELPNFTVEVPPANINADLASNLVLLLAPKIGKPAKEIAEKIIPLFALCSSLIAKVEFSPPGFLNFWITPERFYEELTKIIEENYRKINLGKGEKILFEFVSANPTGPLHIGHGRGAAIGDSLGRIFSFLGWEVKREYYLNDVGNQIENLGKTVRLRLKSELCLQELTPQEEEWLIGPQAYQGKYILDIARKAAEEKGRDFSWGEFKNTPIEFFSQLAIEEILKEIKKDLKDFGIEFDNWVSESQLYQEKAVEETISFLKKKGYTYEKDGALWFKSTPQDEKDRVLVRTDGRKTYFSGDIAYHRNKFQRGFRKLVNLWGADHHGYVARMKSAVDALGYNPDDLKIILYQLVSLTREGKPVAMSTRAGEFIPLREVLQEVGSDACRYFFLTRSPESHLEFDLELAKKQTSENPVYYIQYAHTRAVSILREARKAGIDCKSQIADFKLLKEKTEIELIKKLSFFPDTLVTCVEDLSPHHLPAYLLDLANEFHRYYEKYRVISEEKNLTLARLSLVEAVRIIIRTGLELIGVSAPEKM